MTLLLVFERNGASHLVEIVAAYCDGIIRQLLAGHQHSLRRRQAGTRAVSGGRRQAAAAAAAGHALQPAAIVISRHQTILMPCSCAELRIGAAPPQPARAPPGLHSLAPSRLLSCLQVTYKVMQAAN